MPRQYPMVFSSPKSTAGRGEFSSFGLITVCEKFSPACNAVSSYR
jgi:hypothetical protein